MRPHISLISHSHAARAARTRLRVDERDRLIVLLNHSEEEEEGLGRMGMREFFRGGGEVGTGRAWGSAWNWGGSDDGDHAVSIYRHSRRSEDEISDKNWSCGSIRQTKLYKSILGIIGARIYFHIQNSQQKPPAVGVKSTYVWFRERGRPVLLFRNQQHFWLIIWDS